jgi:hypothetical protein
MRGAVFRNMTGVTLILFGRCMIHVIAVPNQVGLEARLQDLAVDHGNGIRWRQEKGHRNNRCG